MQSWQERFVQRELAESKAWQKALREAIAWSRQLTKTGTGKQATKEETLAFAMQLYSERLQARRAPGLN